MSFLRKILIIFFIIFALESLAQSVYITKTGEKYHKEKCRFLKYSKKEIDIEKALFLGYSACKVCKPKKIISKNSNALTSKKSSDKSIKIHTKKSYATQCSGKTKSGRRCKRRTKNANGRCYQH